MTLKTHDASSSEKGDTTALVRCYHVEKEFQGGPKVFRDATVHVPRRAVFLLSGPAGAGKSVFVRLLLGLEQPDGGQIWIENRNLRRLSAQDCARLRRRTGIVLQETRLLMSETVGANIALPLEIIGMEPSVAARRVRSILRSFGLEYRDSAVCRNLSTSRRKLVAIARATVHDPFLLIADEPFEGMDEPDVMKAVDVMKRLNMSGTTLILTGRVDTLGEAFPGCRRGVIVDGKIEEERPADWIPA